MDYGTLAQLSNPGQAAPGDRWGRIRRFQNLNNLQQQALQSALPVAESNAQRQLQANEEFSLATPGRLDTIQLGNMNAASAVKNFNRDQTAAQLGIDVKNAEQMAKLADVTSDIGTDADAYSKALETGDERLKNDIIQKNKGRRLRNGYVVGSNPNTDDQLFKVAAIARANPPATQGKIAQEQAKGATRLTLENMKNLNDKEKIELRGQIAAKLQGQRIEAQKNEAAKPLSASQALAAHLNGLYGDDHESWLKAYSLIQEASTTLKIDEKAAALRMFPELAKRMGDPAAPRELPPGNPNTASTVKKTETKKVEAKKPNSLDYDTALQKLESFKGTEQEEAAVNFFVNRYGAENLPAWVKKK